MKIEELNKKLKKAYQEIEEQEEFMKEHMEKMNLNENEKKEL